MTLTVTWTLHLRDASPVTGVAEARGHGHGRLAAFVAFPCRRLCAVARRGGRPAPVLFPGSVQLQVNGFDRARVALEGKLLLIGGIDSRMLPSGSIHWMGREQPWNSSGSRSPGERN